MCRRFSLTAELNDLEQHFAIDQVITYYRKRYNIAPTQEISGVYVEGGQRRLDQFRWGLFPFWGKDALNANLNTVHSNPSYPKMLERRRCIIPCSGFYYWKTVGKKSYPVRVVMKNRKVFGLAGLYEIWKDTRLEPVRTCTIVMTEPNDTIREFDHQMPAIMGLESMEQWLDPNVNEKKQLEALLQPYDAAWMDAYPVTPLIGNDQLDSCECIEQMDLKLAWVKE